MKNFLRPTSTAGQQPPAPPPRAPKARTGDTWVQPWPRVDATVAALVGLILTAFAMASGNDTRASQLATSAAYGVLGTLFVSFAFEARGGLRNLVRADLMGLVALYYLTLYEFLFKQRYFDIQMPSLDATRLALWAIMIGFTTLFIARHFVPRGRQPLEEIMTRPVPGGWLVAVFWACFFLGFLHMLIAVKFDIEKMVEAMCRARFDQPWTRGRYGDWKALLNEFALLLYLLPPIAGLMLARHNRFRALQLVPVLLGTAWVFFYGFTSGTRSLFGAYLITFMIAFAFASPAEKRRRVVLVCAACAAAMVMSTGAMLEMRGIGFKRWWDGEKISNVATRQNTSVFVDDNLLAIAKIAEYFPARHYGKYLGLEIPYIAIVRPIPRAIWPGKPKGLSFNVEDIFGIQGVTIAATFVGEAYMSGGLFAVVLEGLLLGLMAGWWNRLASPKNSELGVLIYSAGFFAVTITMRSTFALTTALLPCLAGILAGKYLLPAIRNRQRRHPVVPPNLRNRPPAPPPVRS